MTQDREGILKELIEKYGYIPYDTLDSIRDHIINREQSIRAELEHTKTELNTERVRVDVLRDKISEARKVLCEIRKSHDEKAIACNFLKCGC